MKATEILEKLSEKEREIIAMKRIRDYIKNAGLEEWEWVKEGLWYICLIAFAFGLSNKFLANTTGLFSVILGIQVLKDDFRRMKRESDED